MTHMVVINDSLSVINSCHLKASDCMGESQAARSELFLFSANLIQKLRFEPPEDHPCPDPQNYTVNFTAIPNHFYVKISAI